MITPALLEKFPDAESMAKAEPEEIFEYIKSCSYPNNKAKHLSGMSRMLVNEFGGIVPSDPLIIATACRESEEKQQMLLLQLFFKNRLWQLILMFSGYQTGLVWLKMQRHH